MPPGTETLPLVVIICHFHQLDFQHSWDSLVTALNYKATIEIADDPGQIQDLLKQSPPPAVVLIADEGLAISQSIPLLGTVLVFVRHGGIVIAMGQFAVWAQERCIQPFFTMANLPWRSDVACERELSLDTGAVGNSLRLYLPSSCSMQGMSIKNVALRDMWYTSDVLWSKNSNLDARGESLVALTCVGPGWLGYVGAVSCGEDTIKIILLCVVFVEFACEYGALEDGCALGNVVLEDY